MPPHEKMVPPRKHLPKSLLMKLTTPILTNNDSDSDMSLLPQTQVDEGPSHASITASKLIPPLWAPSLKPLKPPSLRHASLNLQPCQRASQQAIEQLGKKDKNYNPSAHRPHAGKGGISPSMAEIGEDTSEDTSEKLENQQQTQNSPTARAPEEVAVVLPTDPPALATFTSQQEEMLVVWFYQVNKVGNIIKNHLAATL